jgi:sporulation protein YlmC with PRC-barrel domain
MDTANTLDRYQDLHGQPVFGAEGEKIGAAEEVYYDIDTGEPEWLGIGTGFLRTKRVVVPLGSATLTAEGITVPFTKDQVKDSPEVGEGAIPWETEDELCRHYGIAHPRQGTTTVHLERWVMTEPMPDWRRRRSA